MKHLQLNGILHQFSSTKFLFIERQKKKQALKKFSPRTGVQKPFGQSHTARIQYCPSKANSYSICILERMAIAERDIVKSLNIRKQIATVSTP